MNTNNTSDHLENLIVYNKAKYLAVTAIKYFYNQKKDFRKEFVINQVLRAITSIGANIAEGYGRYYSKSFRQFLAIARGSSSEALYWLDITIETKMFDEKTLTDLKTINSEILRILTTLIKNKDLNK